MKLDFGMIFTRMWKIGWRHKVLWLFQFLPFLAVIPVFPVMLLIGPGAQEFLPESLKRIDEGWIVGISLAVLLVFFVISVLATTLAQGAATLGALKVERGAERLSFRELATESLPYFWRILGLYTIFTVGWTTLVFGMVAIPALSSTFTFGLSFLCFIPLFLLMYPIMFVGLSMLELTQVAICVEDMHILEAIAHAWRIFRANIWNLLLLDLILYLGMSTLSSLILLPIVFPIMFMPMFFIEKTENFESMFPIIMLTWFPMIILMYAVQGILLAFKSSAWVVTYLRLRPAAVEENIPAAPDEPQN